MLVLSSTRAPPAEWSGKPCALNQSENQRPCSIQDLSVTQEELSKSVCCAGLILLLVKVTR